MNRPSVVDPCPLPAGAAESRAATDILLGGLRSRGWGPASWARFAGATSARSARQARQHPRAVIEITILHGALRALGGRGHSRWIASSWFMAVTHLGMLGPSPTIGAANTVSIVRANLPVVAPATSWLGILAMISDKADGALARRAGPTQFGHYADALADAAFWAWFAYRHETDRRLLAAAALVWIVPVVAVTAISVSGGRMVEPPRSRWLRPAAAMQAVIAVRAIRRIV
ncbi:MAG: CDP-alcohol phosphatidyltransferase family protein [Actinomycetota bacterium]|nr:CDP-alcohol phosphatidyltransferase family protein [Actinomycetota bacterium]